MQQHRLVIIIPFYNARKYIRECIDSVLMQTYPNWLAICADDHSEDGSSEEIPEDGRIIKIYNQKRVTALPNIYNAIVNSGIDYQDDDILCILDGDDKLLVPNALSTIVDIYNSKPNCLFTFGHMIASSGQPVKCKAYTRDEFDNLRDKGFRAKHLQTFKWKLYKEFLRQDPNLNAYRDDGGRFFSTAYDVAMFFPLMEIAGYPNISVNEKPIYWYRQYEQNDEVINLNKQQKTVAEIRAKEHFKSVFLPLHYRLYWHLYTITRQVYRWVKGVHSGRKP